MMLFFTALSLYLVGASAFVLPSLPNSGRIVGGVETSIENHPYIASLQFFIGSMIEHRCGTSILSANYLLSAAHCDADVKFYARFGSSDYRSGGQFIAVSKLVQHPEYDYIVRQYDSDIAVLTLEEIIVFGPLVALTVLPTSSADDPKENEIATVAGWGQTEEAPQSHIIREVDLPAWDNEKCRKIYPELTPKYLCLGGTPQGGTSACYGDSGGPVIFNGVQVAIVTGGWSCTDPNVPGVYNRVSGSLDWIKEQAGL